MDLLFILAVIVVVYLVLGSLFSSVGRAIGILISLFGRK